MQRSKTKNQIMLMQDFLSPEENDVFGGFALPDVDSEEGANADAIDLERSDAQIDPRSRADVQRRAYS